MVAVVTCLIGLLVGSCFGIFFSGEDTRTGQTVRTAIAQVNQEYQERLEEIQSSHPHDSLAITGSQAVWKEVLAVYAVKTTTDPDSQDVASMDEEKCRLLTEVFWEMNQLSARVETRTETTESEDGTAVETEVTVLVISVSHKTAIRDKRNRWGSMIVKRAAARAISRNMMTCGTNCCTVSPGQRQWRLGGWPSPRWQRGRRAVLELVWFSSRVEWCAIFVSWCAGAGYWTAALSPNFPGAAQVCNGSNPEASGCPAAPRRSRECSSSSSGTAATPLSPTMLASWNGWKTAGSTPLRGTPMTWCGGTAILWGMEKLKDTVLRWHKTVATKKVIAFSFHVNQRRQNCVLANS